MKRANPYGHPDVLCVKVSRFGKFNQRGIQNSSRRTKLARDLIGHRLAEQLWLRSAGGICLTIFGSSAAAAIRRSLARDLPNLDDVVVETRRLELESKNG